jgi:alpha-keto-acid decarboxylase
MNRSDVTTATKILHHTLGDGVFSYILRMHESITAARAILTPETAVLEIDRVLKQTVPRRPPAYLVLPTDVVSVSVVYPWAI